MREQITRVTNRNEAFHGFAGWLMFDGKLIGQNDPDYQEKVIKFNELLANCVMYSTALDVTDAANDIAAEGQSVDLGDLATVSPYSTHTVRTGPSTPPRRTTCRTPAWISHRGCCSPRPRHDLVRGRHDERACTNPGAESADPRLLQPAV